MSPNELEERLLKLAADWPVPSAADAVMARIGSQPDPRPQIWTVARRRVRLVAAVATMAVAAAVLWALVLGNPPTLQAQVQKSLEQAGSAHVVITSLDEKGVRQRAEVWYARGQGFRAESPDEIILDDGRQQWTWRADGSAGELVIARRPSRDAVGLITGMFRLDDVSAPWARQRAPEHDRTVNGRPARGFVVTPPVPQVVPPNGRGAVPDPHPPRYVVLIDPDDRIVHIGEQRQVSGLWQAGREVAIEYDAAVPAEKLAVRLPAGGRVIDADRALAERFPLARAVVRVEAGGLLFAVHELLRVEGDTLYVVSSVRGTDEYLTRHPPRARRLNLQTTLLDVAEQMVSGSFDPTCGRVGMASAESDGVHYLWWLAVRRRFFSVEDGRRTPRFDGPSLEVRPGTVRVPLQATYRGPDVARDWVRALGEVALRQVPQPEPLAAVAGRVRHDAHLIGQAPGSVVTLYGWVRDGELRPLGPDQISDGGFADQVGNQLDWLRSMDQVTWPPVGVLPGAPESSKDR
jgi:hypothetical protein